MSVGNTAAPAPLANMGEPIRRSESVAKVTGRLVYAADAPGQSPLQAYFLTSAIARGRVLSIDAAPAEALDGVVKVYTHLNAPRRIATPYTQKGGYASDTNMPLTGPEIHHDGQIIAMVIAETYEIARDASHRIVTRYDATTPAATIDSPGVDILHPDALAEKEKKAGDFAAALAAAPVKVEGVYSTPAQHQNAIELYSTTASWSAGELTIHEPSQFVVELANGAAAMMGIDPSKVHVVNPYMGGAFGGKGFMTQRTALVAGAARELARPVRNVVTRDQGFTLATYRSETKHHVRLAADHDGRLLAYGHESWEMQSRHDDYPLAGFGVTTAMYGKPAILTRVNLVKADRQTSGFMRAPVEMPYMYPLESAMDELAFALDMDPIELRRVNDIRESPIDGARFTSRSLMRCYDEAAASFGWSKRDPTPGSMREGDWLIGYGCATAGYPTHMAPATARVTLSADGSARVEVAGHDSGQGTYTALGQVAARELGIDPERVHVAMGDSRLPAAPASSNSLATASIGSAVKLAIDKLRSRFGNALPDDRDRSAAFARLGVSEIGDLGEFLPPGTNPEVLGMLRKGQVPFANQARGDESKNGKPLMFAFGAEFVEVRIHRLTREIRVPRMTGAFAAGRIVNPRTARSQLMGGMIWGMSSALLEATEIDEKRGRYVNDSLGEYLMAVNADVPRVDVIMVPEEDPEVNPLGVKGIGELGIVGTAAAVANAVHHATGKRIRDLPIVMDKLLA
ncbi:xanthine dehydrogenase family protein molybdopterin-binding subunit [Lichenifustis flavocetrariae]|uniref:Xanthine dehydrogenase family protein molybdopterin-binding subunit n=1 Tax=Lichenifustis flavocetrariae TaxID=2949735 RepID=A0AA41Z2A8_9HYPH|nr:xanthine dehydrogenase family protein molybdopterin-binding subunit [Lichenifustis flavocetrariae]MCW6511520.1 xanthine dehydrogenase family protein molybdopterin-binding subunit [Lichenifustis flavocetrariae]